MNMLQAIKTEISNNVGEKVWLRANVGRKKLITYRGVLKQVYPNVFTLEIEEDGQKKNITFSYADVFTKKVQLKKIV